MKIIPDSEAELGFRFEPEGTRDIILLCEICCALLDNMNQKLRDILPKETV